LIQLSQAVWLFCPAVVLHVFEEYPRFTSWARKHASTAYTQQQYNGLHLAAILISALSAAVVWLFPNHVVLFLFFAFVFAPGVFFNTLFHAGASALTKTYCPGVVTAAVIYLPLFVFITKLVLAARILSAVELAAALFIAGVFHAWEVGHNVFKAW
jgi:hypothetical protein